MPISTLSSAGLQDQFLTLLVTQLQNQDPIEPVKQENFIAQLAQFSMVEGVENLNAQFSDLLYSQQLSGGFNLVDRIVSFYPPGSREPQTGHVSEVYVDAGRIQVVVGGQTVPITQVVGVHA
jgi:flagellar basal-body rod modification protein FlgD